MTRLEYLRRTAGLSQVALAAQLGCHPSIVCRLERGWQARLSAKLERKLLRAFAMTWTFDQLLEAAPELPAPSEPAPEEPR